MWFHFTFKKITLVALLKMDRGRQGQWARVEAARQVVIQEDAVAGLVRSCSSGNVGKRDSEYFCLPSVYSPCLL